MGRLVNKHTFVFSDKVLIKEQLADTSLSENGNTSLQANQYHVSFGDNIVTMKSDGTKRVGLEFTISSARILDEILTQVQLRKIEGANPVLKIYETNSSGATNSILTRSLSCESRSFKFIDLKYMMQDFYSSKLCKIFIGLEIGEIGTFALRDWVIQHNSTREYNYNSDMLKRKKRYYRLKKTNGTWATEESSSFMFLDQAVVTGITYDHQLKIAHKNPFLGAVPMLQITLDKNFSNYRVVYDKNTSDRIELLLIKNDGGNGNWSAMPDGSTFMIMCECNMYW